jgi:hypothetical protein
MAHASGAQTRHAIKTKKPTIMKFRNFKAVKYVWLILVILTIIAILFKSIYRHYISENNINDFGIADTSPNFFAGLITMFSYFTQSIYERKAFMKCATFALIGLIGYELVQGNMLTYRTFDFRDIFASILGVICGYFLCIELNSKTTWFSEEKG